VALATATLGSSRPRGLPKALSPDQAALLRAHVAHAGRRDRTALALLLDAGLRASEACALTRANVHPPPASYLRVDNGKGGKDRVVPVTHEVATLLAAPVNVSSPWALPNTYHPERPLGRRHLYNLVAAWGEACGFALWPHCLRHTYACDLIAAGLSLVDLQQLLGHASVATTAIYLHVRPDALGDRLRSVLSGHGTATQLRLIA